MANKTKKLEVIVEMVKVLLIGFFDQENLDLYNRLGEAAQNVPNSGEVYISGLKSPEDIKNLQTEDLIRLMSAVYIWDCYKDLLQEKEDLEELMKVCRKIERRMNVVMESANYLALL